MARVAKDTFWNNEREKRGWSFKYIAKKTGIPQSTLGAWFAGIKAPRNEHHVEQLCKLFEIPYDKGYNAFYNAEKTWDSDRKTQHYYDTYWNKLREENNLSLDDISQMTGIAPAVVSTNFSGRNMPRRSAIEKYCKLFDVPLDEGKEEFKKAHEQYLAIKEGRPIEPAPVVEATVDAEVSSEEDVDYTFWPSLFANSKFSVSDIAAFLNIEDDTVRKYLGGEIVPDLNTTRMLCGLYGGIDITRGSKGFNRLHENYLSTKVVDIKKVETPVDESLMYDVLKTFFDITSFDEFMEIQKLFRAKDDAILDKVYGVVSHKTYKEIEAYLG